MTRSNLVTAKPVFAVLARCRFGWTQKQSNFDASAERGQVAGSVHRIPPKATKVERRPTFVDDRTDSRSIREPGAPGDDAYMTPPTQGMAGISALGLYRIDPATSSITFKTRHLFGLGRVCGSFELHDGEIHVAGPVSGSWAEARVSTASFRTGNSARDSSVLSSRLLDAYGHPFITFTATAPPGSDRARSTKRGPSMAG